MDGTNKLARDTAQRFVDALGHMDLSAYAEVDDDAAELLAQYGGDLSLNGLMRLSEPAASLLARFNGRFMSLSGLTEMPGTPGHVALAQTMARAFRVCLDSLTVLSAEVAEALARNAGDLSLNGLTWLADDVAEQLGKHWGYLGLDGLRTISDRSATSLGQHRGTLSLAGLQDLSECVARELSHHRGELSFGSLTALSDTAAWALSQHRGVLALHGLTALSDRAAAALGTHQGDLFLLDVEQLSDAAARGIAQHTGGIYMNNVLLSDAAAKILEHQVGRIFGRERVTVGRRQIRGGEDNPNVDEWSHPPCRDLAFDFPRESAKDPLPLSDHEFDLLMHLVRYREDADLERVMQIDHPSDALLATLASEALQEDTTLYEDSLYSPSFTPYPFAVINSILHHSRTLAHAAALVAIYHHPGRLDHFLEILAGFCPSLTADVLLDAAQKVDGWPATELFDKACWEDPVLVLERAEHVASAHAGSPLGTTVRDFLSKHQLIGEDVCERDRPAIIIPASCDYADREGVVSLFIKAWREENLKQRRDCLQALRQRSPLVELAFHTMTLRVSCDAKRRSDATLRVTPFAPQLLKFWNPQAH